MIRVAIILAGGSGERFWPLSTPTRPKQLLDLTGSGRSLLAEAIERASHLLGESVFVSTGSHLRDAIYEANLLPVQHVIAEPDKRNTLGGVACAMAFVTRLYGPDFTAAILTADHRIEPLAEFQATASRALDIAEAEQALVTIGIAPTRAEQGFGYIETGEGTRVTRFTEKPNAEIAQAFLDSGTHLWNSGMFFWTQPTFARELTAADPELGRIYQELIEGNTDEFYKLPSLPIDKALLEKSSHVHVVPASFEWDDLGSWESVLRNQKPDESGNVIIGDAELVECKNCLAYVERGAPRVQAMGLENMVLVHTGENLAVFPSVRSQDIRALAQMPPRRGSRGQ